MTEPVTRAVLRDRVAQALERGPTPADALALLVLEVDNFEVSSEGLDRPARDAVLIELEARLRRCLGPGEPISQIGIARLAILLEEAADAPAVAERISDALTPPFMVGGREHFFTVSVGICVSEMLQGGAGEMLRNAEAALQVAKGRGGSHTVLFRSDTHLRALRHLDLEAELEFAVKRRELRLHYQPLVELKTRRVAGFEGLVRWAHPRRGLLRASEFIGIAEDTGLIRPISRFVLAEAARRASAWQARYLAPRLEIAVNLSAAELAADELLPDIEHALAEPGLAPGTLVLEVTEQTLTGDLETGRTRLPDLRALGARVSVDHFGTGSASLTDLRSLPIDSVKVAKPLLDGIPEGEQETDRVRRLIESAHGLELAVVGEGVERVEQWDALREMGCDFAQGYLLARPQGPDRIEKLLDAEAAAIAE